MPFTKARPVAPASAKGKNIALRVTRSKTGERRFTITLGAKVAAALFEQPPTKDQPVKCALMIGRGSHSGLISIDAAGDEIEARLSLHGSVRLTCEAWEVLPNYTTTTHQGEITYKDGTTCIRIPTTWREAPIKSAAKVAPKVATPERFS